MSDLKEQNFGFGAGLTALFDYNPGIMPSFIEDVTESEFNGKKTKVTKGKFFKVKTPKENEFVIYIKYSDKLIQNDNMFSGFMWEFPLSETEKSKIELQYQNAGTFLILLVCISELKGKLKSQIALLLWEDYCKIRHRSNIQLGIWNNPNKKTQRAKVYYLRCGKGQSPEYFIKVKRNLLEKKLDELCIELERSEDDEIERQRNCREEQIIDFQYVELEAETLREAEKSENVLYVKDNVKWCGMCRCKTNLRKEQEPLDSHQCPKCNKIYITPRTYDQFKNLNQKANITIHRIRTLVDKVYLTSDHGCVYCDSQLAVASCRLKLYENLEKTNKIEKIIETDLSYCKKCGRYYAEPVWHHNLLSNYGKNKIKFVNEQPNNID